jgi:AcrR family transcriptional regulator
MARERAGVRLQILEAALSLLRTRGVRALSQPRVSKEAGVLQSHLTYYFPKRTDLMLALVRYTTESVAQEIRESLKNQAELSQADPDARTHILDLIRLLAKDRARTRVLLGLVIEADDDPTLRAVIAENVQSLRALVALGMRRSPDDPEVDLGLATLWGLGIQHFLLRDVRSDAYTDELLSRLPHWFDRLKVDARST